MDGREHQRIPYAVEVKFRTKSALLVAYSINLSRGGLFLETDASAPEGTAVTLQFSVPDGEPVTVRGKIIWRREQSSEAGPTGIGVEFVDVDDALGTLIDRLVSEFPGISVLLLSQDSHNRSTITRMIRSIFGNTEIVTVPDPQPAESPMDDTVDLIVVDVDFNTNSSIAAIEFAKGSRNIPVVALTTQMELHSRLREAGADGVQPNPPPFAEFQRSLVRALGKPSYVGES